MDGQDALPHEVLLAEVDYWHSATHGALEAKLNILLLRQAVQLAEVQRQGPFVDRDDMCTLVQGLPYEQQAFPACLDVGWTDLHQHIEIYVSEESAHILGTWVAHHTGGGFPLQ